VRKGVRGDLLAFIKIRIPSFFLEIKSLRGFSGFLSTFGNLEGLGNINGRRNDSTLVSSLTLFSRRVIQITGARLARCHFLIYRNHHLDSYLSDGDNLNVEGQNLYIFFFTEEFVLGFSLGLFQVGSPIELLFGTQTGGMAKWERDSSQRTKT